MFTYYEFFAGGGMVRSGLGQQWRCLLANDICPKKGAAYAANWGNGELRINNVFDLSTDDLIGTADLAWGSFPCQDLSLAGQGAGLAGEHSGAFWGYWKLVQQLARQGRKPRMVMLENVYGALTSREGSDFDAIAAALAREGYLLGAMVIDAVHFLPQSRPRLFILGVDSKLHFPEELTAWDASPAWHPDAVIRAYNRQPKHIKERWRWWNPPLPTSRMNHLEDLIEPEQENLNWHSQEETRSLLESMTDINRRKVMEAQASGKLRVGTIYRRTRHGVVRAEVRFDGISGCLRTPTGGSSRQTLLIVKGERIRSRLLSPREAARLMGLPDDYRLPERYNDAYHLAGDGVAVPVVSHLAHTLMEPILTAQKNTQAAA